MRSTIALAAALAMPMMGGAVELSDDMLNKVYDLMGSMTKHTYVSNTLKHKQRAWRFWLILCPLRKSFTKQACLANDPR